LHKTHYTNDKIHEKKALCIEHIIRGIDALIIVMTKRLLHKNETS